MRWPGLGNLFGSLFGRSQREHVVITYLLREHARGRDVENVLDDPYVRNRTTPEERARLLEQPEVVAAIGDQALAGLRESTAGAAER